MWKLFVTRQQNNNNPLQKVGVDACPVLIEVHFVMVSFLLTCIHSEGKTVNKMKLFETKFLKGRVFPFSFCHLFLFSLHSLPKP